VNRCSALAAAVALAVSGVAFAADPPATPPADQGAAPAAAPMEKPSPECVKSFWNFWLNGKGQGLVLADAKLCLDVAKDGPQKFECTKEVPAEGVKKGDMINVWQAYLVPQNDAVEDISIQLKLGDQVRETKDVKVNGASIRSRSWNAFRIPKAGKWTITITRGSETLKSMEVTAK